MQHLRARRVAALVAAPALSLGGLTAVAPAATAATTDPAPSRSAATWLSGQLTSGLLVGEYGSDVGLTIDAALALDAVGGHEATVQQIADAVAQEVRADNPSYNYVSGEAFGDAGSTYAGAVAKTLVLAQVAGRDLATYGGEDFRTRLEGVVSDGTVDRGRIRDVSTFGDNANTLGQAFAARALHSAGSGLAEEATDFLLLQQCSPGFFRLKLGATVSATCDADGGAPSVDVTALAVLNLQDQQADPRVAAAIASAVTWLRSQQAADGSFSSDGEITAPNANSTGVAGWALGVVGETAAAEQAAVWLRRHQADDPAACRTGLTAERGVVAYGPQELADAREKGLTVGARDQFRRSTAQALPALEWAPAGGYAVEPVSNGRYVRAGSSQRVHADDVAPGQAVCFSGQGSDALVNADASGHAVATVRLPAGTGVRRYQVVLHDGVLGRIAFHALGAKRFPVTVRDRIARGDRQVLTVRGLAAREQVRVIYRGEVVAKGVATGGRRTFRFPVGRVTGTKTVRVVGQFGNRKAARTFTVTR